MADIDNLFEKASRQQFRFDTHRGLLSVEDLWGLPLTSQTGKVNLDDIAHSIHRQLRDVGEDVSFVTPTQKADELPRLQLELVKHIIAVRLAERDLAAQAALRKEQKQNLLGLIASKENEALAGKSMDELKAMVEQL